LVDDDVSVRESVGSLVRSAGFRAETFASAQECLAGLQAEVPSCLVLDVQLPGLSGLDLQQQLAKADVQLPIIFLTGHGDIPMTVRAIKAGALEFLTKPCDGEDLLNAIRQGIAHHQRARQQSRNLAQHSLDGTIGASGELSDKLTQNISELKGRLAEEKLYLEEDLQTVYNFEEIIGESSGLKRVLKQAETVAPTDATVLILGETGTGKELVARAIHKMSARREHTFVKLNCAAIPTGLLESELFGHEKGAFTGAISQKIGRAELAHQGTLFLDEVGDIPLELQPKLLRLLQEKEFERLGGTRTVSVDMRLIAATNRDLGQMVAEQRFRSDLYYRLNVFPVVLPPLRERPEDIPMLARYFVEKYAPRMNKRIQTIPTETMEALTRWRWPGNIRELENFIERAVILSRGPILYAPLGELKVPREEIKTTRGTTLEAAEQEHIIRVLREAGGVIGGPQGAAARLGIKRTTLNGMMRRLGISRKDL
jgi:DNA-binding NtrC family response regulator